MRPATKKRGSGLLPSILAMLIAGFFCWQWLIPGLIGAEGDPPAADASVSELAPVEDQDIPGAIGTLDGSPQFIATVKDRSQACSKPMAWVSIMREAGQPAAKVRLRSGNYISPIFTLTDVPVRVAIPYPAAYDLGHGRLTLLSVGGHAEVALRPIWHAEIQGEASRNVIWHPVKRCVQPNG